MTCMLRLSLYIPYVCTSFFGPHEFLIMMIQIHPLWDTISWGKMKPNAYIGYYPLQEVTVWSQATGNRPWLTVLSTLFLSILPFAKLQNRINLIVSNGSPLLLVNLQVLSGNFISQLLINPQQWPHRLGEIWWNFSSSSGLILKYLSS